MWRYDDICKGETECFFKVKVKTEIPQSSIGFIYLKDFSQANMKYADLNQVLELKIKYPDQRCYSGPQRNGEKVFSSSNKPGNEQEHFDDGETIRS